MAISENRDKLYTYTDENGNKIGISLWEIMSILGYYMRDTNGNRNLGMIIQNADINKWAKCKPFRDSEPFYETEADRIEARKVANCGLLLPTQKNAGVPTSLQQYRYLNYLVYRISSGQVESYPYLKPRGITATYNEPYRVLDFDGYKHKAPIPFTTHLIALKGDGTEENLGTTSSSTVLNINLWDVRALRAMIQLDLDADILLSDLFGGNNPKSYFFCAEQYKDVNRSQDTIFYNMSAPTALHRHPQDVSELSLTNGSQSVDIELVEEDNNKQMAIVLGINEFASASEQIPLDRGNGFVVPWTSVKAMPFLFTINQYSTPLIDYKQVNGYYIASASAGGVFTSFPLKGSTSTAYKGSYSDKLGIRLDFNTKNKDYLIVGKNANSNNLPNYDKIRIRMLFQKTGRTVEAVVADSTIQSNLNTNGNNYQQIFSNQGQTQSVYLRFDGFLQSGEKIEFGVLEFSLNGGEFKTLDDVQAGFDGSSVQLFLERK